MMSSQATLWTVALSITCLVTTASSQLTGCVNDIVFVIDASASVGATNFNTIKSSVNLFITNTFANYPNARVGFVVYGTSVTASAGLTGAGVQSLITSLNGASYPTNALENTHLGINAATNILVNQGRSGSPKTMIVITDSISDNGTATISAASNARTNGIAVYAVRIEAAVSGSATLLDTFRVEVQQIASVPSLVVRLANFNGLSTSLGNLPNTICRVTILKNMAGVTVFTSQTIILSVVLNQNGITGGVWRKNGGSLPSDGRISVTVDNRVQRLSIINAQLSDAATYSFTIAGQSSSATVGVTAGILSWTASQTRTIGGTATITVNLVNGNCNLGTWTLNGAAVTTGARISYTRTNNCVTHTLTITNVQLSDQGSYQFAYNNQPVRSILTVSTSSAPVNGGFSAWAAWSVPPCSVTCGTSASKIVFRVRTCDNPVPLNGGANCTGKFSENAVTNCGLVGCPVNGGVTQWTTWNSGSVSCPQTCGTSAQKVTERRRTCTNPTPVNRGAFCSETLQESRTESCGLTNTCPTVVNGGVTEWGSWTDPACSVTCGTSATKLIKRFRTCTNAAPSAGGANCVENLSESAVVNCGLTGCPASPISARKLTVYFVVDGSESISTNGFREIKDALNHFVVTSVSSRSMVRVGVVIYSNDVAAVIPATSNVTALSTEIYNISQPGSGTSTHLGITRASTLLFKEPDDTSRVMIVMTDGLSNNPDDTKTAAAEARKSGIYIFSVGVNPLLNFPTSPYKIRYEKELQSVASSNETVFQIETFSNLTHTIDKIIEILSSSKDGGMSEWGPWNVPDCPSLTCANPTSVRNATRTRSCDNPSPSVGGRPCSGATTETERRDCLLSDCVRVSPIIIGVVVTVAVALAILVAIIAICIKRRQRRKEYHRKYNASQALEHKFTHYNLELLTVLGEGHFGKVWKAKADGILHKGQSDIVAVKVCKDNVSETQLNNFHREIKLMKSLPKYFHVVNYLGTSHTQESRMLIMEYSPLGNLLQFLRKKRPKVSRSAITPLLSNDTENQSNDDESANFGLTSKQLTMFAYQIAKGLRHLYRNKIIHRDVAARNVLLFEDLQCKVADLGLARHLSESDGDVYETTSEGPLPVRWMAPESLRDRIYTTKSDVWSYGILLWEIVTLGGSPYQGRSAHQVVQGVLNGQTMSRPDHCAPELYSLMKKCWKQEKESRPDFEVLSRNLDTLLEESSNYIKLLDFQDHLYTMLRGSSKSDAEEKL